ncbi:hypothetical protein UPYG_G00238460 [Umbra pygmaea]|uniref:SAP domain-containing protein n=1 Tax=Umbra pygmaea TaxID=75934 RepID=A0ABD0WEU0_UMBPY
MEDEDVMLDLQSLCVADLKAALDQRCLSKSGPKSALIKRLKEALMLENLQRTSTPPSGLQPNSQIGEEMSQNSFIKQYLAKQQELLHQRLEREAREAAGANASPVGPGDEDEESIEENSPFYCADKPAHSMLHLSRSTRSVTVGSPANCLKKDREKDNDEEQEATGLVICTSPGGLQRQDLDSISSEPLAQCQPRVLRPLVHKMTSEGADEKIGKGALDGQRGPGEVYRTEEPREGDIRTKDLSMPVKQSIATLTQAEEGGGDGGPAVMKQGISGTVPKESSPPPVLSLLLPDTPKHSPHDMDGKSEKAGLAICPPSGVQDSESRSHSSSPEPLRHDQPGPLSLQTHKDPQMFHSFDVALNRHT